MKLWDKLSGEMVVWVFRLNENRFVDVVIEGHVTDTLYELGCINEQGELLLKVEYLLSHWKIQWETATLV